jgi:hypothetical protein
MSASTTRQHPGIPPAAAPIPGYSLEDAAWWPCPQPEDDRATMLSVSAHLLGYDQTRSMWLQCLVCDDSDVSDFAFVAWALKARGIIKERPPYDANPLSLFGCNMLYHLAALVHKERFGEFLSMPQHARMFADDPAHDIWSTP